jgi:hypothetical protein
MASLVLMMVLVSGCYTAGVAMTAGIRDEEIHQPDQVVTGADGSVAFRVRTRMVKRAGPDLFDDLEPDAGRAPVHVRYLVYSGFVVAQRTEAGTVQWDAGDRQRHWVPDGLDAPDAAEADLERVMRIDHVYEVKLPARCDSWSVTEPVVVEVPIRGVMRRVQYSIKSPAIKTPRSDRSMGATMRDIAILPLAMASDVVLTPIYVMLLALNAPGC